MNWIHITQTHRKLKPFDSNMQVQKTSRRDLPAVIAGRLDGATTVSATMLLAARAGIPIFVTGGAPLFRSDEDCSTGDMEMGWL